jgi:hypothetical protein
MMRRCVSPLVTAIAFSLAIPSVAAAQPGSDRARAEQHFEAGKRLRKEGKCAEAVEELKASIDFEPTSVGARLNLGDCYVVLGKFPEAFRQYKEAEQSAQASKDPRVEDARKSGAMVEAKLVRVVLREEDSAIPNVTVTVDGASAGARPWASIAVMPNADHQVAAEAPDGRRWSATAKGNAGDVVRLTITLRQQEKISTDTPPPPNQGVARSSSAAAEPSSLRTIGIVTAATGGVLVLTGAIFGALAVSWRSELRSAVESNNGCAGGYPNGACNPAAKKDLEPIQDRAFTGATISTIGLIAGGVLVAAGVTLYLAAPTTSGRPVDNNVRARVGPGSLVIDGTF